MKKNKTQRGWDEGNKRKKKENPGFVECLIGISNTQ